MRARDHQTTPDPAAGRRLASARRLVAVPVLILLALPVGSADLDVQARNGVLTLRARAVPLVEVLERLSREAGFKLVYEGPKPTQRVTVSFEGLAETEALGRLFEGLGIDYAFQTDPVGQRVGMLIVSGSSGSSVPAASTAVSARGLRNRPGPPVPEEEPPLPEPEIDEANEGMSPETEGGDPTYLPLGPGAGAPGAEAPGSAPSAPQLPGPASSPFPIFPGQQPGQVPRPYFPGPASGPFPPVPLPPPSFPGGASTPGQ